MKPLQANCRICRTPITVEFDDDYDLSDPMGLLALATCNRCHDLRCRRESLFAAIYKNCCMLLVLGPTPEVRVENDKKSETLGTIRNSMYALTKAYARLCADYTKGDLIWSDQFPDSLMRDPGHWEKILRDYRDQARKQMTPTMV